MKILAKCPSCCSNIELALGDADKRIRCPSCRFLFKVPDLDSLNKALKVIDGAQSTVYVDANGNLYG